ncbi:hypothetical protein EVAR_27168_1 [Eumeta japonica]|uniref:Uncharacterized protein n=1 Tax=Eumeta variegata TaxID=151549 RepID=A0A4C1W0G1_EUMVA|nr:hypothetical protein EVAR_27168_1 [Eumeta japonica]
MKISQSRRKKNIKIISVPVRFAFPTRHGRAGRGRPARRTAFSFVAVTQHFRSRAAIPRAPADVTERGAASADTKRAENHRNLGARDKCACKVSIKQFVPSSGSVVEDVAFESHGRCRRIDDDGRCPPPCPSLPIIPGIVGSCLGLSFSRKVINERDSPTETGLGRRAGPVGEHSRAGAEKK